MKEEQTGRRERRTLEENHQETKKKKKECVYDAVSELTKLGRKERKKFKRKQESKKRV